MFKRMVLGVILLAAGGLAYAATGAGSLEWTVAEDPGQSGFSNDLAFGVAVQADGKIVAVGGARYDRGDRETLSDDRFTIARYLPEGTLDPDFGGGDGIVTVPFTEPANALDVAIDDTGRIVVVGSVTEVSYRTITTGKGKNKITTYEPYISGSRIAVVRLDASGTLDGTFDGDSGNGNGIVVTELSSAAREIARSVSVLTDGDILVAGGGDFETASSSKKKGRGTGTTTTGGAILIRYTSEGALRSGFGEGGVVIDDSLPGDNYSGGDDEVTIHGMGVQTSNNRIVTLCYSNVVRAYDLTTGEADFGFGTNGVFVAPESDTLERLEIDAGDGDSILVCGLRSANGAWDGLVTRLSPNGIEEWSSVVDVNDDSSLRGVAVDSLGQIVVGGSVQYSVTNPSGTQETSRDSIVVRMSPEGVIEFVGERTTPDDPTKLEYIYDLALSGDDIVLVGDVHQLNVGQDWFLARYSGN